MSYGATDGYEKGQPNPSRQPHQAPYPGYCTLPHIYV